MNPIKILIVDGDAIYRAGLRLLLDRHKGFTVAEEADEAEDVLLKTDTLAPDVIVLNLDLLGTKTSALIRELCQQHGGLRILGLGNDAEPEHILDALNAGMAGYLPRHAQPDDLFRAVQAIYGDGAYLHPSVARLILESYVRRGESAVRENIPHQGLSPRESEVLKLIGRGLSSRQIADYLCLSVKTVERHTANIMDKLDVHRRTELVRYTIRKGLVDVHAG